MSGGNVTNSANIIAVVGASGSGKGARIKHEFLNPLPDRLLIWDFMSEYHGYGIVVDSLSKVSELIIRNKNFRIVYRPMPPGKAVDEKALKSKFELFCKIAICTRDCTVVVEELSFVTTASWAPGAWRSLSVTGRHRGMILIGATQRPALCDKTFFGMATLISCGRLMYENDEKAMAKVLRVSFGEISDMPGLAYLQRDQESKVTTAGVVQFPKKIIDMNEGRLSEKIIAANEWLKCRESQRIAVNRRA